MDISDSNSTKEKIIDLLSYDWPLSLRKIYYVLKKQGLSVTYQAVHKALHQLLADKKLKQTVDGYIINLDWIKEIHDKTEIIRVNYFSKSKSFLTTGDGNKEAIQVFIFRTWFDLEKYIYYLQKNTLKNSNDKRSICIHHHHEWRPLFYLRAEHNWVKKLKSQGYSLYTVCSGKTFLDQWAKRFYEDSGYKIVTGIKLNGPAEMVVFADYVVEIYLPFELLNTFESYITKCRSLENINSNWLMDNVFEKETEIKVVIHKDKKLSNEIRKHLESHFK